MTIKRKTGSRLLSIAMLASIFTAAGYVILTKQPHEIPQYSGFFAVFTVPVFTFVGAVYGLEKLIFQGGWKPGGNPATGDPQDPHAGGNK